MHDHPSPSSLYPQCMYQDLQFFKLGFNFQPSVKSMVQIHTSADPFLQGLQKLSTAVHVRKMPTQPKDRVPSACFHGNDPSALHAWGVDGAHTDRLCTLHGLARLPCTKEMPKSTICFMYGHSQGRSSRRFPSAGVDCLFTGDGRPGASLLCQWLCSEGTALGVEPLEGCCLQSI